MYYSSTLFDIVGFSNPVAVGTVVAGVNWIVRLTLPLYMRRFKLTWDRFMLVHCILDILD